MGNLHSKDYLIKFKQGLVANINTDATKNSAVTGEPHYATDTKQLYIFDGTTNIAVPALGQSNTFTGNNSFQGGLTFKVTVVTDTYQVLVTDYTVVCNKTTAFTVTLPVAVVGATFNIKNINTGTVTVEGYSSDTIDGELNQPVEQWENLTVQCYIANKWIIL